MYSDAIEILQQPTGVLQRLQQLVELIARQDGYDWAGVYVPASDDDRSLLLGARAGRRGATRRVAKSDCPATATIQVADPVDPAGVDADEKAGPSYASLPLHAGGTLLGLLVVSVLGDRPTEHLPLLGAVAEEVAAMLALRG